MQFLENRVIPKRKKENLRYEVFYFVFFLVVQCWFRVAVGGFRAANLWEGDRKFVYFKFVVLLYGESEFLCSRFSISDNGFLASFCFLWCFVRFRGVVVLIFFLVFLIAFLFGGCCCCGRVCFIVFSDSWGSSVVALLLLWFL